jgi:hypothetical protein
MQENSTIRLYDLRDHLIIYIEALERGKNRRRKRTGRGGKEKR